MSIILERIDSVPLRADDFSPEFFAWLSVLSDALNSVIQQIQDFINLPYAPSLTTAEITALSATVPNGTFFYDTDTNQIKAKSNNVIVVIV